MLLTFLQYVCLQLLGPPSRHGRPGEAYWPCPCCGRGDHFHTLPSHPRYPDKWKCWGCGRWGDGADLLAELYPSWTPAQVLGYLELLHLAYNDLPGTGPDAPGGFTSRGLVDMTLPPNPREGKPYAPPCPPHWPALVADGARCLWAPGGRRALAWLRDRGLTTDTIRTAGLGWDGAGGILIPWWSFVPGQPGPRLVAVNVRALCPTAPRRYRMWPGSRREVYPGRLDLVEGRPVLICEGELDTLLAHQELGDQLQPLTLGSAAARLPGPLARRLLRLRVLVATDADEAGDRGAAALLRQLPGARRLRPPQGQDVGDLHRAGMLRGWLRSELRL
jgi:hypothetical protein